MRRERKNLLVPIECKGWSRVGRAAEKLVYAGEQLQLICIRKGHSRGWRFQWTWCTLPCAGHVVPLVKEVQQLGLI